MNLKQFFCAFFCTFCLFIGTVAAQSGGGITLSLKDVSLQEAMQRVQKVSDYTFFYDVNQIDISQKVSFSVKKANIQTAVSKMLDKTAISFEIKGKQIILKRGIGKTPKGTGLSRKITGIVVDDLGAPVIGATVIVQGTVNGVLTDIDGKYAIEAKKNQVLEYRFVGYKGVEKTVGDDDRINVTLAESNVNLVDVVVIGYGSQKKESVVASINSIKPADIAVPTRSLSNSIAGRVAGVVAIQRSGEPGNDDASFWIRGQSSYMGGTNPLILVDGVPRDMNDIDVDEIETFTVLKDAAATAVYGAEGANGVVLITSKRGIAQKTRVDINAQFSIITPTRLPELMDSYNFLNMFTEAEWNDAGNPGRFLDFVGTYDRDILEKYRTGADLDLYPNSDWMELLSEHTTNQRYTINFRGGSEKTKFFASGAYYKEDGIFDSNTSEGYNANTGLQRFNLRSNVDMDITSTTKLSIDLSGQYKTRSQSASSSDAVFGAITVCPVFIIPFYYSDGSLSQLTREADQRTNPYNLLNQSGYTKTWSASVQSKVQLEQKLDFITKGLSVRGAVSFDADFTSSMKRTKKPATFFSNKRDDFGNLIMQSVSVEEALSDPVKSSTSGEKRIYIEGALNYKRLFGEKHDVNGILVYSQKETQYQNVDGLKLLPYRKQNLVGRISYGYDSRYMLEGSFGMTGSENFAEGHRWGIFPAVGAAWYISNESFIRNHSAAKWLSKLKLRTSYGMTGNDNIGPSSRFPYREQLKTNDSGYAFNIPVGSSGGNPSGGNGIVESTFAAPVLSWEIEKKFNVGVDLGFFDNRIDITADYFFNRREDILIQRKIVPKTLGFRVNPWQNFGIVDNKGLDGSLTLNHQFGDLKVSARGNITYVRNEIVEYDEVPSKYNYQNYTGQSIGQPYCYIAEGLYTPDDFTTTTTSTEGYLYELKADVPKPAANVAPGDIKYKDLNGDGLINEYDMTYENGLNSTNPELVYGFGLNLEYKGFFAGIFFQGVGKTTVNLMSNSNYFMPFIRGVEGGSARMEALSHWSADNPYNQDVLYPRIHAAKFDHNIEKSTWWYRDGSFLRLKNVEFGYEFSKDMIKKMRMTNLRLYVQGTNLAVWDNIKLWDPELGNSNSGAKYPLGATWTVGLEVSF